MHTHAAYRLGLVGHAGRMGQSVLSLFEVNTHQAALTRLLVHRTPPPDALAHLAESDPSVFVDSVDVVLDFSAPTACAVLAPLCAAKAKAYLVASTGLHAADEAALANAAAHTPVLLAANLSLGVNVLMQLVQDAATRFAEADIEILEMHHKHKRDAPSGTALALGEAAIRGRKAAGHLLTPVLARTGTGAQRATGQIGYGALRGGDVAGEHTVFLLADGERLELTHRASRPDIFARGALVACSYLARQKAGRYTMQDVVQGLP